MRKKTKKKTSQKNIGTITKIKCKQGTGYILDREATEKIGHLLIPKIEDKEKFRPVVSDNIKRFRNSFKTGDEIPTLTDLELEVVNYLVDEYPLIKYLVDIETSTGLTRKTVSKKIIPVLLDYNLIEKPKNKSKGFVATQAGKRYIEKNFS